jgi:nicotinamide riboside kinase
MHEPLKIGFIGTHGVGKTTLCYGLAARLKARDVVLDIVHEVARRCPLPINERTSVAAQSWILHTQISDELVAGARHPVVICDRSVLDNYVYLLLAGGRTPALDALIDWWLRSYGRLIYVPIVAAPLADGMRSTDLAFQRAVDERLLEELELRGLEASPGWHGCTDRSEAEGRCWRGGPKTVLRLEPAAREQWLDIVEDAIRSQLDTPQLSLL